MKKISIFAILTLSLIISACDNDKSGYVDTALIYSESTVSKEAFARLEQLRKEAEQEKATLQSRVGEYVESDKGLLQFGQKELDAALKELEKKLAEEQERIEKQVDEAVNKAIEKVQEELKLDKVLPKEINEIIPKELGDEVTKQVEDVTEKVLKELDNINLDFLKRR